MLPALPLPVSVRLMPTVSRANKVMMMGVVAQALEACDRRLIQGSAPPQSSDPYSPAQVWGFDTV